MNIQRDVLLPLPRVCGIALALVLLLGAAGQVRAGETTVPLSLSKAVEAAQKNDPWLVENKYSQQAVESMSVAEGTLPDPTMSLGLANFPTDTLDFNQEPMTQVKLGITQMIPRGDSLAIKRKQLQTMGRQFPFQRRDRRAKTAITVAQLWLDGFRAQESIALIKKDRPLFEQLADVAEASYSSALGRTRQQDIVRAQLELTRLDDRLTRLKQLQETVLENLSGWMQGAFGEKYLPASEVMHAGLPADYSLARELPQVSMLKESLYKAPKKADPQELYTYFSSHPSVKAVEKKIEASDLGVDLARQKYKPKWGVNASYGYRGEAASGDDRADFVSLGVSFDLPFFTKNRQDKEVEAAVSKTKAVKTKKWALIRRMIGDFEKNKAQLRRLDERQHLFHSQLLPQMHEQAEASLTAYTNDDGDFAEVVRARIAELNARIDALAIDVERQKTIIRLNYFFMQEADDVVAGI